MKSRMMMMLAGCGALGSFSGLTSAYADVTVEPAGMKVVWDSLKDEFDGFKTYNSDEGVEVVLGLKSTDGGILGLNKDKSKIKLSAGGVDLDGGFGHWSKVSKDGKTMRVELRSKKLPEAEANDLKVNGKLTLISATKKVTHSSELRAFKKGEKVELTDAFKFEVSELGKPKWGDEPLEITLKWKKKIPELAAVRFMDADGNEIKSSSAGAMSSNFMGVTSVSKSYKLKKKVAMFKIEMDLWEDMKQVEVPVDMTLGLDGRKK